MECHSRVWFTLLTFRKASALNALYLLEICKERILGSGPRWRFGGWTKQSMVLLRLLKSGDHQLRLVVSPIIYKVWYISGGARFQPSTVSWWDASFWMWYIHTTDFICWFSCSFASGKGHENSFREISSEVLCKAVHNGTAMHWLVDQFAYKSWREEVFEVYKFSVCLETSKTYLWFPMGVSKNRGGPKSSISIAFSIINHPFWGKSPYFWVDTQSRNLRTNKKNPPWLEELVPGFKDQIPEKRFETAAELSMHPRAKEKLPFVFGYPKPETNSIFWHRKKTMGFSPKGKLVGTNHQFSGANC